MEPCPRPGEPYPFRCPNAGRDDADHVLRRELDPAAVEFPVGDDPNPFLRFRSLLHAYHEGLTIRSSASSCGGSTRASPRSTGTDSR